MPHASMLPRDFICPTCSKGFGRNGDLTRHKLIHIGHKPHACSYPGCESTFSQQSGLKTHMNTHTKAKPFACGLGGCTSVFGDPSSCARHRKEKHELKTAYKCPKESCNTTIKRKSAFIAHLKKHGIDPKDFDLDKKLPRKNHTRRSTRGVKVTPVESFGTLDDWLPTEQLYTMPPEDYDEQFGSGSVSYSYNVVPSQPQPIYANQPYFNVHAPTPYSNAYLHPHHNQNYVTYNSPSPSLNPPSLSFSNSPSPAPSIESQNFASSSSAVSYEDVSNLLPSLPQDHYQASSYYKSQTYSLPSQQVSYEYGIDTSLLGGVGA